ncbi:hypothetical protein K0H71_22595 [Bacillus sp. IITD106]|nr:hypothetical protein [Bacillus sp. IITD106]
MRQYRYLLRHVSYYVNEVTQHGYNISLVVKIAADAVKDYICNNNNVFYHDITVVAKEAIKKDVKRVMEVFLNKGEKIG